MSTRWLPRLRRRWRPPRTLEVTRAGKVFLLLTVGVGLGALNTGNNLLYLLFGLQLATIVTSGVLSERCLRGLSVRRLGTDAAFAGEPFAWRWAVRRSQGSAYSLTLSEAGSGLVGTGQLGFLPPGDERVVRAEMLASTRGPLRLEGIRVTTPFPLGLFVKGRIYDAPATLLVYPRRVAPPPSPPPSGGPWGERRDARHADGDGELAGLRPLRPDEDARGVAWVKSAAVGRLLKVERERATRSTYLLSLGSAQEGALDRACEDAAALARALLAQGHEVGLEAGPLKLRPAAGPHQERRVLEALAKAGFEEAFP